MSISPSSGYKRSGKRVGALAFGRQSRARRKLEWTRGCDDLLVPLAEPRNTRAVSAFARECVCTRWRSTRGARARTLTTSSAMAFAGAVTAKAASCISACASRAAAKVPGICAPASRRPGAECGSDVGGDAPDERGQWNARARNAHSGTRAPARPCMHASTRLRCGRARARAPAAECYSRICNRSFIPMPTQAAETAPASSRCDRFSRSADVTHAYPREPLSLRPKRPRDILNILIILNIPRRAGRPRQRRNKKTVARVRAQGPARAQTLNHAPWRARNGQHARLMALWATYPPLPSLRARARTRPAAPVTPSSG